MVNGGKNKNIALIKIKLSENDIALIKNKNDIECKKITKINKDLCFDLNDVYLVFESSKYLDDKIQNEKFLLAFLNETETELFCSWGTIE